MARIGIKTKYLGPTNYRGSRIKATAMDTYSDGKPISTTLSIDFSYGQEEAHRKVAEVLVPELYNPNNYTDTKIELIAGATKDGYVFVAVNKS